MNETILIDEKTEESSVKKTLFPNLQQIIDCKIQFNESFDTLLLFDYQVGTIDINSYFSKIAYLKNDKLFVFTEYENPEHTSYEVKVFNENNFKQSNNKDIQDFFIESMHYYYHLKYPQSPLQKRLKI